jgi:hypothetical protein
MFRFSVSLNCGFTPRKSYDSLGDIRKMADWIDDLAQKAKDKYTGQRQEDEKFNREQKLKEALSNDFWKKLYGALEASIAEFNKAFGSPAIVMTSAGQSSVALAARFTAKDKRTATANFQPDKHRIFVGYGQSNPVGYYMDLVGDSQVFAKLENETLSPDDFARKIITTLMSG